MAATMERLQEYRTHNTQFCKRILDFLSIMFTAQVSRIWMGRAPMLSDGCFDSLLCYWVKTTESCPRQDVVNQA